MHVIVVECKIIVFTEWGNYSHQYMLEPILLSDIQPLLPSSLTSHSLQCGQTLDHENSRLCTFCIKQVWQSEYHTSIQTMLYLWSHFFSQSQSSTQPNLNTFSSHNHNMQSQLWDSWVKFLNIKSCYTWKHYTLGPIGHIIHPTHATSQSRVTQVGSLQGHCKGVAINWKIAVFHAQRPLSPSIGSVSLASEISPF